VRYGNLRAPAVLSRHPQARTALDHRGGQRWWQGRTGSGAAGCTAGCTDADTAGSDAAGTGTVWLTAWRCGASSSTKLTPATAAATATAANRTAILAGLDASDWDQMISALTVPYRAQRDAELYIRRGGPPASKPAIRHAPALTLAEQVLVTVLRQRFRTPQHVLAELFGVVTGTIAKAERQVRPLLQHYGPQPRPACKTGEDPGRADGLCFRLRYRSDPQSQTSVLIICEP
jgi:hypothetical protein